MFTQNELTFLYQMLDQLNVRGEDQKTTVLNIMGKIRGALIKFKVPEKPSGSEDKMLDGPSLTQDEPGD